MGTPVILNPGSVANLEEVALFTPVVSGAGVPTVQPEVSADQARAVVGNPVIAPKGRTVLGTSPMASAIPVADKKTEVAPPAAPTPVTPPTAGLVPAPTQSPEADKPAATHSGVQKVVTSATGKYETTSTVVEKGTLFDTTVETRTYKGTIKGFMVIPNLEKAIALLTGQDTNAFKRLPLIMLDEVEFSGGASGGTLKYGLNSDSSFARNLGYWLQTSVSRKENGIVVVSWTNHGKQPKESKDKKDLLNFSSNNGSWTLKPVPGYTPAVYEVTWTTHTIVDNDTLSTAGKAVGTKLDGTITASTLKSTRRNFEGAAAIIKGM